MMWKRPLPVLASVLALAAGCAGMDSTPQNPMTRPEVEEKAFQLIAPVLGGSRTRALIEAVWKLDELDDARSLRPLLMV